VQTNDRGAGSLSYGRRIRTPLGFPALPAGSRVRLVAYALFAALAPLALAVWALGERAERAEIEKTDATLTASLRTTADEFTEAAAEAGALAFDLARAPGVGRAFAERDAEALARLSRRARNIAFVSPNGTTLAGRLDPSAIRREVDVVSGGRTVGRIVVGVPFDQRLLARLEASTIGGTRIAIARGRRILVGPSGVVDADLPSNKPGYVRLGRDTYRAVGVRVVRAPEPATIAVLKPRRAIDAAVAEGRRELLYAALAALAGIGLIAYALAPAIVRGRLALAERTQAARVLLHVADGVFLVDAVGTITFWNPAAEAITGLRMEEVRGRAAEEAIPGWADAARFVPIAGATNERVRPQAIPLRIGERELWVSASGVRFSQGIVYAFRDVTEERRVEELRSDFVATVSHELRTPLASVLGAALTLKRDDGVANGAVRDQLIAMIAEQSGRLARIVDEILLASSLASGGLPVVEEHFDPVALARATVEAEGTRIPDHVSLELAAPPGLPPVRGDRDKARQVLVNLIDNAVKYSPDGGRIEVLVDGRDEAVQFSVRDEGLGVPASEHDRIFEKFYRLDPKQSRGVGGTGLGLYISRELVRRMNGRIVVASEPGVGSTFSFELPVQHRAEERPTPAT
jgi:two-component system phosphate regulon sensor histidine kinase PhoR